MDEKLPIDQPTAAPTRKVLTGAIAGVLTAITTQLLGNLGPAWLDFLALPGMASGLPVIASFAAAYLVRDVLKIPPDHLDKMEELLR